MRLAVITTALILFASSCVSVKKAERILLESNQAADFCARNFPSPVMSVTQIDTLIKSDNSQYESIIRSMKQQLDNAADSVKYYTDGVHLGYNSNQQLKEAGRTISELQKQISNIPALAHDTFLVKKIITIKDSSAVQQQRLRAESAEKKLDTTTGKLHAWQLICAFLIGALLLVIVICILIIKRK